MHLNRAEDKKMAIPVTVVVYLSADKATGIENAAQMQIFFPENVQFSLSDSPIYMGNLKWKFGALALCSMISWVRVKVHITKRIVGAIAFLHDAL